MPKTISFERMRKSGYDATVSGIQRSSIVRMKKSFPAFGAAP